MACLPSRQQDRGVRNWHHRAVNKKAKTLTLAAVVSLGIAACFLIDFDALRDRSSQG
jgi:hypothetical protein